MLYRLCHQASTQYTGYKTDKNGSRGKTFKDNFALSVCQYAASAFEKATGISGIC